MKTHSLVLAVAVAALFPALAMASCGAAFCTVNTNWTTQSALAAPEPSFDVHYEYIDQDQPMTGGDKVAVGSDLIRLKRKLTTAGLPQIFQPFMQQGTGTFLSPKTEQTVNIRCHRAGKTPLFLCGCKPA